MLLYPLYYRQHGVRRPVQLVAPTLSRLETLDLPRDSILHFVSEDEALYGMPQDDYLLRNIKRMIYVDHVRELGDSKGPPRPTRLPPGQMIRDYHRKYRMTRQLNNLENALRDGRTLIVENYALLPHLFRYTTSFFRNYYKWWNIQAALWTKVDDLAKVSERQQFIECRLPTLLPTLAQLRKGETITSRTVVNAFVEHESLFVLELWKWLGPHRANSVLSKASSGALAKMNLIWMEGNKWVVVNLGQLDQWRRPTEEEIKAGATEHGNVDPVMLQKRFLRMLMHLFECRAKDEPEQNITHTETVPVVAEGENADPTAKVTPAGPQAKVVESPLKIEVVNADAKPSKLTLKPNVNLDHLPVDFIEETPANALIIDEAITKDLEALNHLHQLLDVEEGEVTDDAPQPRELIDVVMKYEPEERTLESGVMSKVDALADAGALSGAEYRRFTALAKAYTKLPDPYGKAPSLEAHAQIDPATLVMPTKPQIKDMPTVVDKSMLKSTLMDFDAKYVEQVLSKDVTNAVLGLQYGGVAVTGYQVETIEDALNRYEAHTVNVVPVQGKASTLHFRLPKVEEDGTFLAGGVRYRLRKQRGDLPIRKLSPEKVALTSYYSKVFVSRSDKQVHNYPGWLTNQIAARGMDPSDNSITHLMVSNVFDSSIHTPRVYSIMAERFRSFELQRTQPDWSAWFFFDYAAREAEFGADVVKDAEKGGLTIVGKRTHVRTKAVLPIVMDAGGTLYDLSSEKMEVLGTFETLLGLDVRKAPQEVAVVKVLNKLIPVGIFLGYHMGLSSLLDLLKVSPRRVTAGERINLGEDEYALVFEDETLVFTKDNRYASLILAGFNVYANQIANYPSHQFDRRDIYFNVLDQSGVGVKYLREMELLVDMFVDPITKEILESMKEPTDFIGLLLRSCDLLQTDWAPNETDMSQMRIKGYERFAGAVYGEMVKAIRLQRSRGAANAPIDLTPYAVWQTVLQDPAVKLVEDSNPVHNLKEKEEVTYGGVGGRSARSMVARTRVFDPNDMGVISEATKDSADVAITTFLTADPHLKDLRGVTGRYEEGNLGPTSLLSTSALLAPAADRDDQLVELSLT